MSRYQKKKKKKKNSSDNLNMLYLIADITFCSVHPYVRRKKASDTYIKD